MEKWIQGAALLAIVLCGGCGGPGDEGLIAGPGGSGNQWRLVHAEAQLTPFSSLPTNEPILLAFVHPDSRSMFAGGFFVSKTQDVSFAYDNSGEIARVEGYYSPPTYRFSQAVGEDSISLTQEEFLNYPFTDEKLEFVSGVTKPFFKQGDLIYSVNYDNISASDWSVVTNKFQKSPTPLTLGDSCDGEIWSAELTQRIIHDPAPPRAPYDYADGFEQFCITNSVVDEIKTFVAWDEVYSDERKMPGAPPFRIFNDDGLLEEITYYNTTADAPAALFSRFEYSNDKALKFAAIDLNREFIREIASEDGIREFYFYVSLRFEAEYLYPKPGVVTATLYKVDEDSRTLIEELTATYENIACGSMTQERDNYLATVLFPTCISTYE